MTKKTIKLKENEPYITLGVLLKISGVISTGGQAKYFLEQNEVLVNKEKENRRGRKLYHGDEINILNLSFLID